jgi:hypothetical protein
MPPHRDLAAFNERAPGYEGGWRGKLHHEIAGRTVMRPGARLVLVDQFLALLAPTLLAGRRGKARTKPRAARLLTSAGFRSPEWHDLYTVIIKAVTATT